MTLSEYVRARLSGLIDQVAEESRRAVNDTSDEAIHNLRVAIRRLSENLRVFEDLFPRGAAKTVRKDLRVAMRMAGSARNHDIARELMEKASVEPPPEIGEGRERAAAKLSAVLANWNEGAAVRAWREQLHV